MFTPGVHTTASSLPPSSAARSSAALSASPSVTSTAPLPARPPARRTRSAVASAAGAATSRQKTWAPCPAAPRATASPMPEPAPMTATTLASRRNRSDIDGSSPDDHHGGKGDGAHEDPREIGVEPPRPRGERECDDEPREHSGRYRGERLGFAAAAREQPSEQRNEQRHAKKGIENRQRLHDGRQVDRQHDAERAADDSRRARNAQEPLITGPRVDVSLVEILRERRRQHEQHRIAGVHLGRKHR